MHNIKEAAAYELGLGIAECGTERRVEGAEAEVEPDHRLAKWALFEQPAKPFFTFAQRRLGKLARGYVDLDTGAVYDSPARIPDQSTTTENPPKLAVRADNAVFDLELVPAGAAASCAACIMRS
jgi:hypothetical protein